MKTKVQKKRKYPILDKLFKGLVAVAIIIFGYSFISKDSSLANFSFGSKKKNTSINRHTPQELTWFDSFRGVENVPDKNAKKRKSGNNSGFQYTGFNK